MAIVHVLFFYEADGGQDRYILLNKNYDLPTIESDVEVRMKCVLYDYRTYFKTSQVDSSKYIKIKLKPSSLVPIIPKLPPASQDAILLYLPLLEARSLKANA